ncbi:hypothetical protein Kpol_1023p7 [Vanderwaltozyma polyspora DSM 70294]|uniref:Protein transport protein BOS1 n=1 Tax=Vanderwaltozyma polyspora (strain ATCC 22028 / DSM 70294 / BCRC 21397 / CBS 2163 / NBRC 10782 / NRRL Y-8283 / UCD 57-17) TaxID=436907 RepID=A7TFN0_VANPO|nr:uncharacterized protein Kpol_1023p7 [Vanderwaltozyma polyspora DSM 70294]EDO18838.1 hypothetical protein Kpol_1023p7 [Vanderwaltozyma polyspora DSM 70294]
MNAIYNHAVKQKNQLQQDIAKFEKDHLTAPISLQGSVSATLVAFEKSISQYKDRLNQFKIDTKNSTTDPGNEEIIAKGESRLASLSQEHKEFAAKFKELKQKYNESNARTQLFSSSSTSENPFSTENSNMNKRNIGGPQNSALPMTNDDHYDDKGMSKFDGLMKEQSIFQRGNAQLDMILEMGQQSLEDIMEQNQILQKVQDQMTSGLRTLGVSDETITNINRRVFKDKLIFWIALALMFIGMYLVLRWLR